MRLSLSARSGSWTGYPLCSRIVSGALWQARNRHRTRGTMSNRVRSGPYRWISMPSSMYRSSRQAGHFRSRCQPARSPSGIRMSVVRRFSVDVLCPTPAAYSVSAVQAPGSGQPGTRPAPARRRDSGRGSGARQAVRRSIGLPPQPRSRRLHRKGPAQGGEEEGACPMKAGERDVNKGAVVCLSRCALMKTPIAKRKSCPLQFHHQHPLPA
jgi:hypothetical protein